MKPTTNPRTLIHTHIKIDFYYPTPQTRYPYPHTPDPIYDI